jgi:hypothetical protein
MKERGLLKYVGLDGRIRDLEEIGLVSPASGWWQVVGNYGHGYVPLGSIKWEELHD